MPSWIDGSLYPDTEIPREINSFPERVDFLVRLCGTWDFGVLPEKETIAEIRHPDWRQAVDACQLLTSPTYHLLRSWHNLPAVPYLGRQLAYIRDDPSLQYI